MKNFILIIFLFCSVLAIAQPAPPPSPSPDHSNDEAAVLSVVNELFEAYRVGDADRVAAALAPTGNMQRVVMKDGKSIVTPPGSLDGFVNYVRSGLKGKHDEPLWETSVHVDGDLASVWTKFAFYLEGKFHHCGVENFLLHKEDGKWRIFHLVDTSQTQGCDVPPEIKAKSEF